MKNVKFTLDFLTIGYFSTYNKTNRSLNSLITLSLREYSYF